MTPHEFTEDLMDELWADGYFERAVVSRKLLSEAVLARSIHNHACDGTCQISDEELDQCILKATEAFVDEAIMKFSEMGLITMQVEADGTVTYLKNLCRARQLGYA
jgi:hypothetical protein